MAKSRDVVKERYWRGVIRRLEASGLGTRRFCEREGVPERRLYWWRRRLRGDQDGTRRPPSIKSRSRVSHRGDRQDGSAFLPVGIPVSLGVPIEVVQPSLELSAAQWSMMLQGIDLRSMRQRLRF